MDQLQYFYPPEEVKPKDMLAILRRRKWFIFLMVLIGVGLAIGVSYMETPRWEADGQILLLSRAVAGTSPSEQDQNYTPPLQETIDTQAALILTDEVAYRTLDKLKRAALAEGKHRIEDFGFPEDSDFIDKFASKWVRIEVPKLTDDIVVYGTGKSRHAALLLTNAVCQSFVEWKNQIARRSAKSIAKNLQARANAARQRLQIADARYAAFKNAHHVVDLPTQQANLIGMEKDRETEVANNQQALNADQAKLDELTAQVSSATSLLKSQGIDMRDDAVVSKLQDTLSQDEQNLLVMEQQYTDNFPGKVPQMKQQIASLKKQIKDAVYSAVDLQVPSLPTQATLLENYKQQQVVVSYDRAKLTASQNGLNAVHALEAGIPPMALLDSRLKREVDMDTALYQSLATAATSATTDIDRADGNVEIIQGARVPEKPFSPDFVKNTLVGILLALLLGVGCSLVMDQSDNRIREIGDIKRLVAAPIIGMLPKLSRSERKALARGESPARVIEAAGFANAGLERALSRAEPDRIGEPDVILVTSTVPGEGKSTTAAELAKSIARTGKRVTLVDADMTRPAQNRLFNTAEPTGLADVLEGRMSVADALVDSDIENLSILHGGQLTRNPMHLVSSPRMREALGALRAEADVVIIDTPASAVVADALHIARFADCVVYVIGLGKPDAGVVHDAVTALNDAGPHVAFFVNRVSQKQRRSFRSYYVVRTPGRRSGLGGRQDDEKLLASAAQDQSSGYGDEEVV